MDRPARTLHEELDKTAREERREPPEPAGLRKTEEFRTFIFLTVVMAPVLAVMIVGGYGFLVWIYQLFVGPPGSP